ncbi:hypothetical protein [Colwellia sp. TT2012]|uniref:hypothetical protein n=1 Tax=Colwellia sp. TT2012 TaxID=1720342 RepID=UPI000708D5F2|nr:hypothetical protein [Colwellia sp. TT2012]
MKKTVIEIYALLVCFVSVVCFSIWLGIGMYSLIGVLSPETTIDSWTYQRHQSNEKFIAVSPMTVNPFGKQGDMQKPELIPEDTLTKNRLDSYAQAFKAEVRTNSQSIIRSVIVIVISMLLFWIHWRLLKPRK